MTTPGSTPPTHTDSSSKGAEVELAQGTGSDTAAAVRTQRLEPLMDGERDAAPDSGAPRQAIDRSDSDSGSATEDRSEEVLAANTWAEVSGEIIDGKVSDDELLKKIFSHYFSSGSGVVSVYLAEMSDGGYQIRHGQYERPTRIDGVNKIIHYKWDSDRRAMFYESTAEESTDWELSEITQVLTVTRN